MRWSTACWPVCAPAAVLPFEGGEIRFEPTPTLADVSIPADAEIRRLSAEQSNSSLIVGGAVIKLLRRITPGIHPEVEMSHHLTARGYANTPPLLGAAWRVMEDGSQYALIVVQGFVANQGDGWTWTQDFLARVGDALAVTDPGKDEATDSFGAYVTFAATIGRRLAELHAVLAQPTDDPAFNPVKATADDVAAFTDDVTQQMNAALKALEAVKSWSTQAATDDAAFLLQRRHDLAKAIAKAAKALPGALKTRIHGDFHLGQVLVAQGDAFLIDFEGEPSRPLAERRAKSSPLRDVAGMIRSIDYARAVAQIGRAALTPRATERRVPILDRLHADAVKAFLDAYRAVHDSAPRRWTTPEAESALLDLFLIQKAAYEVCYEAANRQAWIPVPLRGFAELAARLLGEAQGSQS